MKVYVDFAKSIGPIKPMNAVNNGPYYTKNSDQNLNNMADYRAANIPFARTHDASFCPRYGGEHTVDVHLIFPDFDASVDDPASYDFHLTDEYMETIMMAGTRVFYRLGSKIEHASKKYGTLPPKDFHKWAAICEHIIAHMNEGWADGHHYGIEYWEIWNEADMVADDDPHGDRKTWGGTREQFFELYEITAKRLKSRFPELKIGGPALCSVHPEWTRPFLERCRDHHIPLDFFSWHCYATGVQPYVDGIRQARQLLDEYGFTGTETNLNEWNYVRSFGGEDWRYSLKTEISIKGAAFIAAVMSACQNEPLDMLMYYDARPCSMNGLFSEAFLERRKGYYPIAVWGELARLGNQCAANCPIPDVFVTAARSGDGRAAAMIAYYTDCDEAPEKTFMVHLEGLDREELSMYVLDEENDMDKRADIYLDEGKFSLMMKPNSVIILK